MCWMGLDPPRQLVKINHFNAGLNMNGFHFYSYFVEKKAEWFRLIGLECAMEFRLCA